MDPLKLIQSHPLATEVVYEWFLEKVLESFTDEDETERYKQIMSIERDEQLSKLIADQPRLLFDVFDKNDIYIDIMIQYNETSGLPDWFTFNWEHTKQFKNRRDAEKAAVDYAFRLLEVKLTPINVHDIETILNPEVDNDDNNL
jgi:hypothetical protein